jgi:hypothetical protein
MKAEKFDNRTKNDTLFARLFPEQVNKGERKPKTWQWILTRIQDGKGVYAPRNLIDLVNEAKQAQIAKEQGEVRKINRKGPLIEAASLEQGLRQLSRMRVDDTLIAEIGESARYVHMLKGRKSEQDLDTLRDIFGLSGDDLNKVVIDLKNYGLLAEYGTSFKIPPLYRTGLDIKQGKELT